MEDPLRMLECLMGKDEQQLLHLQLNKNSLTLLVLGTPHQGQKCADGDPLCHNQSASCLCPLAMSYTTLAQGTRTCILGLGLTSFHHNPQTY